MIVCSSSAEELGLIQRNFELRGLKGRFLHSAPAALLFRASSILAAPFIVAAVVQQGDVGAFRFVLAFWRPVKAIPVGIQEWFAHRWRDRKSGGDRPEAPVDHRCAEVGGGQPLSAAGRGRAREERDGRPQCE